jgi:hypothetical protein
MGSNQGFWFQPDEAAAVAFDEVDGFRTVVHDPDWPYLVGAHAFDQDVRGSPPTNGGCNGLSSIEPFHETVLLQARSTVDPTFLGFYVNGSTGPSTRSRL